MKAIDEMFGKLNSKPYEKSKSKYEARLAKLIEKSEKQSVEKIPETPSFQKNSPSILKSAYINMNND